MWLETITVRTPELHELEGRLPELIDGLEHPASAPSVAVFRRDPPMSDLSVHLRWDSVSKPVGHCGIRLAAALAQFGSVDHAVWQSLVISEAQSFAPNPRHAE